MHFLKSHFLSGVTLRLEIPCCMLLAASGRCCSWLCNGKLSVAMRSGALCCNRSWSSATWVKVQNADVFGSVDSPADTASLYHYKPHFCFQHSAHLCLHISNRGLRLATKTKKINPGIFLICFYSAPRISLSLWCWSHLWLLQGILFIWSSDYPRRYNKGRCNTVVN